MVKHVSEAALPTRFGDFRLHVFASETGGIYTEHMALVAGKPDDGCLARIHSECATGDIMGSLRCDCRAQLETALGMIAAAGNGMLIYLRGHEGRGIGLGNKVSAYALQESGMDTASANTRLGFAVDQRDYVDAVAIFRHFSVTTIDLLTNNSDKIAAMENAGIKVRRRVPLWVGEGRHNAGYLKTKRQIMGHLPDEESAA